MQTPPQIVITGFDEPEGLRDLVEANIGDLADLHEDLTVVRVVVAQPHRRHRVGRHYEVRIQVGVPGDELVIDHSPGRNETHEDAARTVIQAFRAARRQVREWMDRELGRVKLHREPTIGTIVRLFDAGYGFLLSAEGREIYFHANALSKGTLDDLELGDRVRFVEESGNEGPQATLVTPTGPPALMPVS